MALSGFPPLSCTAGDPFVCAGISSAFFASRTFRVSGSTFGLAEAEAANSGKGGLPGRERGWHDIAGGRERGEAVPRSLLGQEPTTTSAGAVSCARVVSASHDVRAELAYLSPGASGAAALPTTSQVLLASVVFEGTCVLPVATGVSLFASLHTSAAASAGKAAVT